MSSIERDLQEVREALPDPVTCYDEAHPALDRIAAYITECPERRPAERQCLICFDHGDSSGAGRLVAVHERCLHELDRNEAGP